MDVLTLTFLYAVKLLPALGLIILPLRRYLRFSPRSTMTLVVLAVVVGLICTIFIYQPNAHVNNFRFYFSMTFVIATIFFYRAILVVPFPQLIFTVLIVKSYLDNVALLLNTDGLYTIFALNEIFPLPAASAIELIIIGATLPTMYLFIKKMLVPLIDLKYPTPFWRYLWIIPLCFYAIYRFSIYPHYLIYMTYPTHENLSLLQLSWVVGTFLSYYTILRTLAETEKKGMLREQLHISELQLAMQQEHSATLQSYIEQSRQTRHDLRHHLLVMQDLIQKKEYQKLEYYVDEYLNFSKFSETSLVCENFTANAIAAHYITRARAQGMQITATLNIPKELPIADADLCIILGNLLENAVEACARQTTGEKFIQIKAGLPSKNTFVISVKNSFDHPIERNGDIFLSSKRGSEGIGTVSIRNIVEKYNGIGKFIHENGVFHASILLNITKQNIEHK